MPRDPVHPALRSAPPELRRLQRELHRLEQSAIVGGRPFWRTHRIEPAPPQAAGFPWPVAEVHAGQPVPALLAIPPTRWARALVATAPIARRKAPSRAAWLHAPATLLVGHLDALAPDVRWRQHDAGQAVPVVRPGRPKASTQLNIRLRPADRVVLEAAADRLGTTPSALARTFVVEGALQVHSRTQDEQISEWRARGAWR